MVDRFICPASRLEELLGVLMATMVRDEAPWRVAVTAGWLDELTASAGAVRTFDDTAGNAASVDLVEVRVPGEATGDSAALAGSVRDTLRAFPAVVAFEIPWDGDVAGAFAALAAVRDDESRTLAAKIRCGGQTADSFPPPDAVARFLLQAEAHSLPVKATAGLHRPFRHTDEATGFTHHGFINLLVAAALAAAGAPIGTVTAILAETDPAAFEISPAGLSWRDHRVTAAAFDSLRPGGFVSYGSCSFQEPVEDLAVLGVLPQ